MTTKLTLTALVATATLAIGGFAIAQTPADAPTSTPGRGCTATANAMRAGNMGASATNKDCVSAPTTTAAAPAAPITQATTASSSDSPTTSSAMGASADTSSPAPMRVARADRN
jgi:hypothetical protein